MKTKNNNNKNNAKVKFLVMIFIYFYISPNIVGWILVKFAVAVYLPNVGLCNTNMNFVIDPWGLGLGSEVESGSDVYPILICSYIVEGI